MSSYSPSDIVKQMHAVPHLDSSLSTVSNSFDITIDSTWNDYTKSLLPMPLICMAIGLLAVIVFQISSWCYCCCKKKPLTPEYRDPAIPNIALRNCLIAFAVFFVVVLVYDQSLIFGNEYLSNGVDTVNGGLDYLETTFTTLDDYADQLNIQGNLLVADFTNSRNQGCAASQTFLNQMDDYFSYISEYQSYVSDVPDQCSDAQDAIHKYAVEYKNNTVWVFYAMFILCALIFAFGLGCRSKGTVFTGMCVTDIVMFFTFIICGVTMILLMVVADFCMEPTDNILMIAPDSVYNVTAYYTTCVGENPMQPSLNDAETLVAQGKAGVTFTLSPAGSCQGDVYLQDSLTVFDQIQAIFTQIETLIACPPNQKELLEVMNDGMCGDTYKGIWVIWLAMFVCAAALFAVSVSAACAYPHFTKSAEDPRSPLRPASAASAPHEDEVYASASPHHPPASNYYQDHPVATVVGSDRHTNSSKA